MFRMALLVVAGLTVPDASDARHVNSFVRPDGSNHDALETYRQDLYHEYSACSDAALIRILGESEAVMCSVLFLAMKLSFLDGVTLERYVRMPAKTKAMTNEKGYAAYRTWLHRYAISAD
ncbi:hypothetical protein [Defluviimonas sp. SAOS-178_SWC]|uniref:hypothetical protein n=1 Tax=Defluviimonas sp. SAOS-178_SWC TaxID=3121287 RepID=UPI0032217F66